MTIKPAHQQTSEQIPAQELPPGSLNVLQITDTHLYANPEQRLLGLNTLETLREVLDLALAQGLKWDLVLATGDMVHDASPAGYRRLSEEFACLDAPVYCLPGNHDVPEVMRRNLGHGRVSMPGVVDTPHWRIVLLDSVIADSEGGRLEASELERLEMLLAGSPEHALVCLHHQPLPVGSAWIDTMALENADAFFAILDRHPQVRGVLWGHIHQDYESDYRGIPLIASPSTCIQFTPRSEDFSVDTVPPGCRFLTLLPDGGIRSRVARLDGYPEGLDLASAGY